MNRTHSKLFVRYALVGVINTVFYSLLLWVFMSQKNFPISVSVGLAFAISMFFQYFANKYFTFRISTTSTAEIVRYLIGAGVSYATSVFVVWVSLKVMLTSTFVASFLSASVAAIVGYLLAFFWIYKK